MKPMETQKQNYRTLSTLPFSQI